MCDHIFTNNTFTTKPCGEVFQIQTGLLNCNSEKVIYFLGCNIYDDTPYVRKAKTKFRLRFNNYKSEHRSFRKGKQNILKRCFHSHYIQDCHRCIDDRKVTLSEKFETHKKLKEGESFWQHKLKSFCPLALNKRKDYLLCFMCDTVHKFIASV